MTPEDSSSEDVWRANRTSNFDLVRPPSDGGLFHCPSKFQIGPIDLRPTRSV
jgi:hypothetical protein